MWKGQCQGTLWHVRTVITLIRLRCAFLQLKFYACINKVCDVENLFRSCKDTGRLSVIPYLPRMSARAYGSIKRQILLFVTKPKLIKTIDSFQLSKVRNALVCVNVLAVRSVPKILLNHCVQFAKYKFGVNILLVHVQ